MHKKGGVLFVITFCCFLGKNVSAEWITLSSNTGCAFKYESSKVEKIGNKARALTKLVLSEKDDNSIMCDVIIDCKSATYKEGFTVYFDHGKSIGSKEYGSSGEILNSTLYKLLYHKICE